MADKEIRTIMSPLINDHLLLPSSVIAEILAFTRPDPLKNAPSWILGEIAWHGWQVPVIFFEQLIQERDSHIVKPKSRILIIKTLGESTQVNYIGLVIQGLPKLKKVSETSLLEKQTDKLPDAVFSKVSIDDQQAFIPEIGELTRIVEQAAYDS